MHEQRKREWHPERRAVQLGAVLVRLLPSCYCIPHSVIAGHNVHALRRTGPFCKRMVRSKKCSFICTHSVLSFGTANSKYELIDSPPRGMSTQPDVPTAEREFAVANKRKKEKKDKKEKKEKKNKQEKKEKKKHKS